MSAAEILFDALRVNLQTVRNFPEIAGYKFDPLIFCSSIYEHEYTLWGSYLAFFVIFVSLLNGDQLFRADPILGREESESQNQYLSL